MEDIVTMTVEAPERATTSTLTLTPSELASIASVAVAASKESFPPIIQTVRLEVDESGELSAMATDRYRIARVRFIPRIAPGEAFAVTLPAKELVAFAKTVGAPRHLEEIRFTLEVTDDGKRLVHLSALVGGQSVRLVEVYGDYPSVARLIPSVEDLDKMGETGPLALNLKYVADAGKVSLPGDGRGSMDVLRFYFTMTENPAKPGPVLLRREWNGATLDYLVQPNLMLR